MWPRSSTGISEKRTTPCIAAAILFGLASVIAILVAMLWTGTRNVPIKFFVGLITAVYAYLAGSVQTDIKSALSFASLSQVGIIVAKIGLGYDRPWLRYVALVHIIGHTGTRTLQFVRAPSLLQDYRTLENAIGNRLPNSKAPWERLGAERL